jgi:hypothetical protein
MRLDIPFVSQQHDLGSHGPFRLEVKEPQWVSHALFLVGY